MPLHGSVDLRPTVPAISCPAGDAKTSISGQRMDLASRGSSIVRFRTVSCQIMALDAAKVFLRLPTICNRFDFFLRRPWRMCGKKQKFAKKGENRTRHAASLKYSRSLRNNVQHSRKEEPSISTMALNPLVFLSGCKLIDHELIAAISVGVKFISGFRCPTKKRPTY